MSVKRLILLGIVVAALAVYYNIKEVKIAGEKRKAEELKAKIFPTSKDDIAEYRLVFQDKTVRVAKTEKGWKLLEPLVDKGDQMTLDNMAANLTSSITLRVLKEETSEKDLEEYGLDKPYMETFAKLADGSVVGPALMGDMSPFGGYVYMRKPGDKNIYLANALFRKGLDKSLYELRDKIVLHFDEKMLKEIVLAAPGERVKAVKDERGMWSIAHPKELPVDYEVMKNMFLALRDGRIKRFVEEEAESLEPYGLKVPAYRYTFSPLDDGSTATLLIGKSLEMGEGVYAKYQNSPKVFALGGELWDKLPKSLYGFRRKHIISFSNRDIRKIEIEQKGLKLVSERNEEDEWSITSPRKLEGGYYEIHSYMYAVKDIEALRFIQGSSDNAPEYGFQPPFLTVKLWPENAQKPISLVLGGKVKGGEGRYARADSVEELVVISDEAAGKLLADLNALRDKNITSFEEKAVNKVVVKFPEVSPFVLVREREGEDKWRLVEPVDTKVDFLRVKSTIWRLEALKYNEIITEEAEYDEAQYGFDKPSVKVTLWGVDEGKPLDIVTLGNPALKKDNVYVRAKSRPGVYTTDSDLLDRIPATVEELKRKM